LRTRQSIIEDSFSIAVSGTKSIDIDLQDIVSRITILPKVINPNAWVDQGHPAEVIQKIELIDGNDTLVSLTGTQAIALGYYSARKVPVSSLNYSALQYAMCPIDIYFGRFLFDTLCGLDPKKFTNLQLKITHDLDAAMAGTAEGYITVKADVFDDVQPEVSHFLISTQLYNLTLVADAVSYIDLPQDYPMRLLMSHCFSDSQAPEYQIDRIKLSEAADKKIIFDSPMEEIQQYAQTDFPPWCEKLSGRMAAADVYFWVTPSFEQTIVFAGTDDSDGVLQMSAATGGQKRKCEASAVTEFEAITRGWAPHGSLPLVYPDRNDDLADYWDIGAVGGSRLKVTAAAGPDTTPTWDLIAQQLRPQPA